jgi:biotin carboxylase
MGIDIVLPIEETYSRLIAERADSLSSEFLWATPPARAVLACLDKPAMFERCRDLGVPTEPFVKTTRRELVAAIGTIGLPCVVRPSDSTRRVDGEKAIILESPAQLGQSSCLDDLPADAALIVQKKASGARENIYFAASRGALIGVCQAHIARTDRLDGSGLAVEGATVEPDADLIRWTQSLTRSLDYTGVGCAQFLMGRGANEAAFLEINPRIAGNHAIAERAGLPLAKLSIELANGKRNNSRMIIGKKDLRFAWTYGDMRGLREAVRGGKLSQRAAAHWAGRIVAAALSADLHMTFSPWDPLPTLVLMARQLGLGRLFETKYRPYFPLGEAAQR